MPRSLSGQLALVLAGALLVATIVNFVLLIAERQRALLIEQSGPPIARFVDVSRDVFALPPAFGQPVAIPRQGPGRYQVQAANFVDNRALPRDAGLEQRLLAALTDAGLSPRDVRASVRSVPRPERGIGGQRERLGFGFPDAPRPRLAPEGGPISTVQEGRPRVMEARRDQRVRPARLCWRRCRTSAG